MKTDERSNLGVASVERAFTILDAFRGTDGILSLAALADRTKFYKSTILRLIVSLESFGYIRRLESGEYQLGPTLAELSAVYQASFRLEAFVTPILQKVAASTRESATFYVRDGDRRICLLRVEAPQHIRDHVRIGDALPLNVGAAGKILLRFADGPTGSDEEMVIVTRGERQDDTAAIASPVFGVGGRLVGALSVSGPRQRFTKESAGPMSNTVLKYAAELSATLGADPAIFSTPRSARLSRR